MPALFRRREVILPTVWGWLLVLGLVSASATWLGRSVGAWLALNEPAVVDGGGAAALLVVEGWLPERELDDAAAYARQRGYRRVVTSGGRIQSFSTIASYAERAAQRLRERLPGVSVEAVPTPDTAQDRTYASAVWVRDWAQQRAVPVETIDVYSLGAHARRTRLLYSMAFGEATRVGIIAGTPHDSDVEHWWTTSEAAKNVLMEVVSLAWTQCCFWPAARGSHDERWGAPRSPRPAPAP
jgi:uncharacterized SAM-binding protein YcdF (DUF218 family)